MKVDLDFAELHTPLFLAGKNWQLKLYAGDKTGLKLAYDRVEKELLVSAKGKIAIVPMSNVASMQPAGEVKAPEMEAVRLKPGPRPKAQVSGPHDHVFAQGPGKTRD